MDTPRQLEARILSNKLMGGEPSNSPPVSDDWLAVVKWLRSPTAPQALVYRMAALGALAAYVAVVAAGGLDLEGSKTYFFSEAEYYSVVAQVLPVLFLTFAVERRFFQPDNTTVARVGALLAFGLVVIVAAVGELLCLAVIGIHHPPPDLKAWASQASAAGICGAMVLVAGQAALDSGILGIAADFIETPWEHLEHEAKFWKVGGMALAVLVSAIWVWTFYKRSPESFRQVVIGGVVVVAIALLFRFVILLGRLLGWLAEQVASWLWANVRHLIAHARRR